MRNYGLLSTHGCGSVSKSRFYETKITSILLNMFIHSPPLGDIQGQCKALHSVAEVHRIQGCSSLAIPYLEEAVSLSGSKERLLAKNLSSLATVYLTTGER